VQVDAGANTRSVALALAHGPLGPGVQFRASGGEPMQIGKQLELEGSSLRERR
jgi:hypothetical protein